MTGKYILWEILLILKSKFRYTLHNCCSASDAENLFLLNLGNRFLMPQNLPYRKWDYKILNMQTKQTNKLKNAKTSET